MSKAMMGIVLLASVMLYDPPLALGMLGPQAQMIGWKIKSAVDLKRIIPQFARFGN